MYTEEKAKQSVHHHSVAILANDVPGVLTRITGMFLKRNFSINTITAGHSTHPGISRIVITFSGDDKTYEQLVKQAAKFIDVIKVEDLPENKSVIRELALIKIKVKSLAEQNQVMLYCNTYRAHVVNMGHGDMIVELTGKPDKIEAFLDLVKKIGVIEIARSGVTAMHRNSDEFENINDII
jgi:acetolactate synthase-1/3 small subunit